MLDAYARFLDRLGPAAHVLLAAFYVTIYNDLYSNMNFAQESTDSADSLQSGQAE